MTTVVTVEVSCPNCGTTSNHQALGSTNEIGSPDLDLRPPPMARYAMEYWLQECPACGLVAPSLATAAANFELLTSPEYLAVRDDESIPKLARRFLCNAILLLADGKREQAFQRTLSAAWVADDHGLDEGAVRLRSQAAALYEGRSDLSPTRRLILLDVLRRAGAWQSADALASDLAAEALEDPLPKILAFQARLIGQRDVGCYRVEQALK